MKIADALSGPGASRRDVLIGSAGFIAATSLPGVVTSAAEAKPTDPSSSDDQT
jgi:hypothetical protein